MPEIDAGVPMPTPPSNPIRDDLVVLAASAVGDSMLFDADSAKGAVLIAPFVVGATFTWLLNDDGTLRVWRAS